MIGKTRIRLQPRDGLPTSMPGGWHAVLYLILLLLFSFRVAAETEGQAARLPVASNAFLWVGATPARASIKINGRVAFENPVFLQGVPPSKHISITVSSPGYVTREIDLPQSFCRRGARLFVVLEKAAVVHPTPKQALLVSRSSPTQTAPKPPSTPTPIPTSTPMPTPTPPPIPVPTSPPAPTPEPVSATPMPAFTDQPEAGGKAEDGCAGGARAQLEETLRGGSPGFKELMQWHRCFVKKEDWSAAIQVIDAMLKHHPEQTQGSTFTARAQACYEFGGREGYLCCIDSARRAEQLGGLTRCDGWLQQQLLLTCRHRYESRSGGSRGGLSDALVNGFLKLQNDLEGIEPDFDLDTNQERQCYADAEDFVKRFQQLTGL